MFSPQPTAHSLYYIIKINLLCFIFAWTGTSFNASATGFTAFCPTKNVNNPAHWNTTAKDVFIAADDFAALPIGEPVSLVRAAGITIHCPIPDPDTEYGIGMAVVPGASNVPGLANVFTTPQLQSRGLGYTVQWYTYTDQSTTPNPDATPMRTLTTVTQVTPPIHWLKPNPAVFSGGTIYARADGYLQFVKIGNITNHDGRVSVSPAISTELMRFYLAHRAVPLDTAQNVPLVWNSPTIATKVRACTPTVLGPNPNYVNLGTITPTTTPTVSTVLVTQPFTLTFNCPSLAFERIGFRFDPTHGTESPTIMRIKPGANMAKGVGIRILADLPGNGSWTTVNYAPNSWYYIPEFNVKPWWEWTPSDDPLNDAKSRMMNFQAELVRVDGAFAPGKVESSLIIWMRYK